VAPARQAAQHRGGRLVSVRLAQNQVVDDNDRVGADDGAIGTTRRDGCSLGQCQTSNVGVGTFSRQDAFVHVGWHDVKRKARSSEQVGASRRGRCQHKSHETDVTLGGPLNSDLMESVQHLVSSAIARIVRPAPLSDEKVMFAWRVSVGPALARLTRVSLGNDGVLNVVVEDGRWVRELERSSTTILERLRDLLGVDEVRQMDVTCPVSPRHAGRRTRT